MHVSIMQEHFFGRSTRTASRILIASRQRQPHAAPSPYNGENRRQRQCTRSRQKHFPSERSVCLAFQHRQPLLPAWASSFTRIAHHTSSTQTNYFLFHLHFLAHARVKKKKHDYLVLEKRRLPHKRCRLCAISTVKVVTDRFEILVVWDARGGEHFEPLHRLSSF